MTALGSKRDTLLGELRFQLAVTKAMLGTLELDQILYIILSGITHGDGLGFNRAFLFLADESRGELVASTAIGPASSAAAHRIWEEMEEENFDFQRLLEAYDEASGDPAATELARRLHGFKLPLAGDETPTTQGEEVPLRSLLLRAVRDKKPFYSNVSRAFFEPEAGDGERIDFSRIACVPLILGDRVVGGILADNHYNEREVGKTHMRGLSTVGNLAAIAIDKANLHRRIKEMAERDGLTGVANRGYYMTHLAREVARARRTGATLALIVLDIDHFKSCNDNHGHECGDFVLKELAQQLRSGVRTNDLVARFGGEEFVVVMRGANLEQGAAVAEKLRRAIEESSLGGRPAGEITVSAGVAELGPDGDDDEHNAIFRRADRALYRAKGDGRNRVDVAK